MTTKRMSEERFAFVRECIESDLKTSILVHGAPDRQFDSFKVNKELLAEIDALRAELTAARTVEDGEVADYTIRVHTIANHALDPGPARTDLHHAADLLTRLSAELTATHERENETAGRVEAAILRLTAELAKAERERDSARADALEEAAKVCEHISDGFQPYDGSDRHPEWFQGGHRVGEICAAQIRIRALKTTQERGTQKGTQMNDETAWLIERGDTTTSAPKYLMVTGGNIDQTELCTGTFQWTTINHHALRFSRRVDANLFVAAIRYLSDSLPHGKTLPGLRSGDLSPRVCEHQWITPTQESETP